MKNKKKNHNKNKSIISTIICNKCKCRFNDIFPNYKLALTYNCNCNKIVKRENINNYFEKNREEEIDIENDIFVRGRGMRGRGRVMNIRRGIIREKRKYKRINKKNRKIYFHDLYNPLKQYHISDLYNKLELKEQIINNKENSNDIINNENNYNKIIKQAKILINYIFRTFFNSDLDLIPHNFSKKHIFYEPPFFIDEYLPGLQTRIQNLKHPYLSNDILNIIKIFILDVNASILIIKKYPNYKINLKLNIKLFKYFKKLAKFKKEINNSFNDGYQNQIISNHIYQIHYIKEKNLLLFILNKEIRIYYKYDFLGKNCLCSTSVDVHDAKILKINYEFFIVFYSSSISFLQIEYDMFGIPNKITFPEYLINNDIKKLNSDIMVDVDIIDENNILFIGKDNKVYFIKKKIKEFFIDKIIDIHQYNNYYYNFILTDKINNNAIIHFNYTKYFLSYIYFYELNYDFSRKKIIKLTKEKIEKPLIILNQNNYIYCGKKRIYLISSKYYEIVSIFKIKYYEINNIFREPYSNYGFSKIFSFNNSNKFFIYQEKNEFKYILFYELVNNNEIKFIKKEKINYNEELIDIKKINYREDYILVTNKNIKFKYFFKLEKTISKIYFIQNDSSLKNKYKIIPKKIHKDKPYEIPYITIYNIKYNQEENDYFRYMFNYNDFDYVIGYYKGLEIKKENKYVKKKIEKKKYESKYDNIRLTNKYRNKKVVYKYEIDIEDEYKDKYFPEFIICKKNKGKKFE